jgi:rare lipoprotein A
MTQCPDIALASPQSLDIPLPKSKPTRHDRHPAPPEAPAPAAKAAAATPRSPAPGPATQPDVSEPAPEQSPARARPALSSADEIPARPSPAALSLPEAAPSQPHGTPPKSRRADSGNCGEGKRVISAYYWEGQRTASGERFNPHGLTAAHRTLPFGTRLTVSNPRNGKSVIVVINDRGPFVSGVALDLSLGAAQALAMRGTGAVCISTASATSDGKG